jgi:hypothetical protein
LNFGTSICISEDILEAAGKDIAARPIRRLSVKGRKHEFMVYELLGIRNSDDPELTTPDGVDELCHLTKQASCHFERGELNEAARCYEGILQAFPGDPVARSLLVMCSISRP